MLFCGVDASLSPRVHFSACSRCAGITGKIALEGRVVRLSEVVIAVGAVSSVKLIDTYADSAGLST